MYMMKCNLMCLWSIYGDIILRLSHKLISLICLSNYSLEKKKYEITFFYVTTTS